MSKDQTPIPYFQRNPAAQEALSKVNSPGDIDDFVAFARTYHFKRALGYEPPILPSDPNLSHLLQDVQRRGLFTPANLASVYWNQAFENYPGSVENLRAEFTPPGIHAAKTPKRLVNILTSVSFVVKGDLISETRQKEAEAQRQYILFLVHPIDKPHGVHQHLLLPGLNFYGYTPDLFRTQNAVYLGSELIGAKELRPIMGQAHDRVRDSRNRAARTEIKGKKHPFQGGSPGLIQTS